MGKKVFLLIVFLVVCLVLRFFFSFQNSKPYQDGQEVNVAGVLLTEPKVSGLRQNIRVSPEGRETIFVQTSRFPEFHYGQRVKISGTVKVKVLENEKTINTMYFPRVEAEDGDIFLPFQIISFLRNKLIIIFS